ncbi:PREDICTED: zinc finger protein 597 [Dipodomys ordii]|uniref:Zinc finger protein 597 n=1 Tax=Dipodomys ordii TaxID=10020 RepID=A0A1S3ETP9_DIPOR|nr:PREDICTED: zinc finger protein 597 [Dipodomys ordii]
MASTSEAQGPMLFEDLAVHFSQEECVSPHAAPGPRSRKATKECLDNGTRIGVEGKTDINPQLSLESMEFEEHSQEHSIASPLVDYPESSEDEITLPEWKISSGTSTCKKRFINLLITIDNHTPLVELSQYLGTRTLSEITEPPGEEPPDNVYQSAERDQTFCDNSYLGLRQKTHSRENQYTCDDCGKIFNHRANLRTHRRVHTGEKPYKCVKCAARFRQHSHLSRHMKSHTKQKPYPCAICGRGFKWLSDLTQHQKSHTAEKTDKHANHDKNSSKKPDLSLPEHSFYSSTQASPYQNALSVKSSGTSSSRPLLEQGFKEEPDQSSTDDENYYIFSQFKPLQCLDCDKTFPCFSKLISHQSIHTGEKPHKCKVCAKSFALESELACHQKSHTEEKPYKCTECGKSFKVYMRLIIHRQTHKKSTI